MRSVFEESLAAEAHVTTDATLSANLTHLPTPVFIVLWAGIALALIGASVYLTFIRRD